MNNDRDEFWDDPDTESRRDATDPNQSGPATHLDGTEPTGLPDDTSDSSERAAGLGMSEHGAPAPNDAGPDADEWPRWQHSNQAAPAPTRHQADSRPFGDDHDDPNAQFPSPPAAADEPAGPPEELLVDEPQTERRTASTGADADFRRPQRWVVIGPTSSGKSSFVASLEQAVSTGTHDGRDLRVQAGNNVCQELFSDALGRLTDEPIAANAEAKQLQFTLEARQRPLPGASGGPFTVLNVELADAAGSWMFSSDGSHRSSTGATQGLDELSARWPTADSLLVLVPAFRVASAKVPVNQEIRAGLTHLLRKMRTRHSIEDADLRTPLRKLKDKLFGRHVELGAARRLAFKRVLICVTLTDVLAQQLLRDFEAWRQSQDDPDAPKSECPLPEHLANRSSLTPQEIAEALEPVATVRAKVSDAALQQLLDAVAPGCPVAVSLMSVKGFNRDGDPLADTSGLAQAEGENSKTQRWRERVVDEWRPWGVRAALYFLATGETTPGAPLELLTAERLMEIR